VDGMAGLFHAARLVEKWRARRSSVVKLWHCRSCRSVLNVALVVIGDDEQSTRLRGTRPRHARRKLGVDEGFILIEPGNRGIADQRMSF